MVAVFWPEGHVIPNSSRKTSERQFKDNHRLYSLSLKVFVFSSPEFLALKKKLEDNCVGGMCLRECLPVAREIHKNPCFDQSWRKMNMTQIAREKDPVVRQQLYEFWYRMDSCMQELQSPVGCQGNQYDMLETKSAATSLQSLSAVLVLVLSVASYFVRSE